jgi:hypothetical protein
MLVSKKRRSNSDSIVATLLSASKCHVRPDVLSSTGLSYANITGCNLVMSSKKIKRVDARVGYDLWSDTYDSTPNPVVAMDSRHSIKQLAPDAI